MPSTNGTVNKRIIQYILNDRGERSEQLNDWDSPGQQVFKYLYHKL